MLNKFIKALTITAICASTVAVLHAKEADKATQDKIHDAMEDLKSPSKKVKRLARGKKYADAAFAKEFAKFMKAAQRMKNVKHPDKEFNVVSDQYGSPTWSYSLARQIQAVIENDAHGMFHATSESYCTWYDLATAFLNELRIEHNFVPCSTAQFPTPTKRPVNSILENQRAKELGINVFSDWKLELREFTKRHGERILKEIQAL